ncbi:MAG: hypothetical protein AAGB29_03800 [Planctomycetota bacterium]
MSLRLALLCLGAFATLTLGLDLTATGQAVRTNPNGNYDSKGKLVVRGGGGLREKVNADITLNQRMLDFQQTNGNSPLSGSLRIKKKVGATDTKVNANVTGKFKNTSNDAGRITKGKLKVKTTRTGGFSLKLNTRGDVTRGDAKGASFSIKLKGSSS